MSDQHHLRGLMVMLASSAPWREVLGFRYGCGVDTQRGAICVLLAAARIWASACSKACPQNSGASVLDRVKKSSTSTLSQKVPSPA